MTRAFQAEEPPNDCSLQQVDNKRKLLAVVEEYELVELIV